MQGEGVGGGMDDRRENVSTCCFVRHNSPVRKSGSDPAVESTLVHLATVVMIAWKMPNLGSSCEPSSTTSVSQDARNHNSVLQKKGRQQYRPPPADNRGQPMSKQRADIGQHEPGRGVFPRPTNFSGIPQPWIGKFREFNDLQAKLSVLCILKPHLYVDWLLPYTGQLWDSQGVFLAKLLLAERRPGAVSLLASHQDDPGSIPGGHFVFSHVGIVPDDAVRRRVFSGISHFPRPFIPAQLHTHPSLTLIGSKTSMLRAFQLSSLRLMTIELLARNSATIISTSYSEAKKRLRAKGDLNNSNKHKVSEEIWATRNIEVLRANEGEVGDHGAALKWRGGGNGRSQRKPADQRFRPALVKFRSDPTENCSQFVLVGG
ncbi:hypothetical protein PR048_018936 [Dryococelus australis]|uniref:Uncharacterized protein n=1 Tax=Dryococelus australis TaxID=614101 RepID=A0ABQ9H255_9NEOP|nr:hypothetical protein PR048_018936 [Dryococelus australis]